LKQNLEGGDSGAIFSKCAKKILDNEDSKCVISRLSSAAQQKVEVGFSVKKNSGKISGRKVMEERSESHGIIF